MPEAFSPSEWESPGSSSKPDGIDPLTLDEVERLRSRDQSVALTPRQHEQLRRSIRSREEYSLT